MGHETKTNVNELIRIYLLEHGFSPTGSSNAVPFDLLIFVIGSTYYAVTSAGATSSNAVFATLWNATVTTGTTRRRKVVVRGDITVTANCSVPGYVSLDFSAATFTRSGDGYHMFSASSASNIDIRGGIINSTNKAVEAYDTNEIQLTSCTDCLIDGVTINNAAEDAIRLATACINCKVVNCSIYSAQRHSIIVVGTGPHNIVIANNYCNDVKVYDAITIYTTNGSSISVVGNTVEDVDGTATSSAAIQLEELGSNDENNISCVGNTIEHCQYGIGVASSMRPVTVTGNAIRDCEWCIFLQNTLRSVISGNIMDNTSRTTAANYGIFIYGARQCTISNNSVWGDATYTIAFSHTTGGSAGTFDTCTFSGNTILSCKNAFDRVGQYNVFTGNTITQCGQHAFIIPTGASQYNLFIGNFFINNGATTDNTYDDFNIGGSAGNNMYGLHFIGNFSYNDAANRIANHINFTSAANTNNIVISLNRCVGMRNVPVNGTPASVYLCRNNINPITENAGTSTIANGSTNSGNVAHGLGYTPVAAEFSIMFTENPTNTPGAWWISGIDGTNFVLNVENDPGASGLDFSWSVRRVN